MSSVLMVVGEGMLADYVCEEMSYQHRLIRQTDFEAGFPEEVDLVLILHDSWNPSVHQKAEAAGRVTGIPWLRGFVSFGEGIIGPLVRPGIPGCFQCADMRRLMAGRDRNEMWEMHQKLAVQEKIARDPWASRIGLRHMAYLLHSEIEREVQGSSESTNGRMILVNLKTLESSRHFILPDSQCSVCSDVPDDSPDAAQITLSPSRKIDNSSYRCRSLDELNEVLPNEYLDDRTGLLNGKMFDFRTPLADVVVNLPLFAGDEGVAGRTHSYAMSELTAILEGLERSCGLGPKGKRTVVHNRFNNLQDDALHPLRVGVHAAEQYEKPDFPFRKFDPEREMNWVWGYSFLQQRPVLVPELLAYYSMGWGEGFVYETSNGCALGGSMEEAILYGIFEVVERDSFLITWYAQLPLRRLDPYSSGDRELMLMVERVRSVAGYEIYLYNSTMEHGIPSVWAMAKNLKQKGLNLVCAAGAHLDPIRAAKSAIHELAGMMLTLDDKFEENQEEYRRMLQDSSLVQKMDDHGMLYGLPQAQGRLQFLLEENRPLRTFDEEFKWKSSHSDLTADLQDILQVFRELNIEVIVVDQTSPEIRRSGLYCVKVLIPGMLPMTFGYHLTRLTGLDRVLRIPMELGYTKQPLTFEQLNPYPHPFP